MAETPGSHSRIEFYKQWIIPLGTILGIGIHLFLRYALHLDRPIATIEIYNWPLIVVLVLGGGPLVLELLTKMFRREFGSDLLAGISIVTSVLLHEYLAGALVVLMLSGGEALEAYAVRSASSVLQALAKRMPSSAHRKQNGSMEDVPLDAINIGDVLVIFPHEICPVDGAVVEGHGVMDESYLTGEPYMMSKTPGAAVISGAINGETALTIRAEKRAVDSRYAKIMQVMRESEQRRPKLRRLGDQLGALYTPIAVAIAIAAWAISGEAIRFLAVMVIATPCPLLIAIPVSIIGSISLSARRGIIIKDPVVLERVDRCRVAIFDKTGTLTYGEPRVTEIITADGFDKNEVLKTVASVERYSKHPLAEAVIRAANEAGLPMREVRHISEKPGEGLTGEVDGKNVLITSRKKLSAQMGNAVHLPPEAGGLECVIVINDKYAATMRFRDEPRHEGRSFIQHLTQKHHFKRLMLVSGDRESEVRYLADRVGIGEVYFSQTPEQKVELVREITKSEQTLFMGDGINDAPALTAATVGIAFGQHSDVTAEAAGVVILDSSLEKTDEFLHISQRMRAIALQSAVGGMALSIIGMGFAAFGFLPPVAGAICQEIIDVLAVVNALRVALPPKSLTDYD